jgi:hypothetical protein
MNMTMQLHAGSTRAGEEAEPEIDPGVSQRYAEILDRVVAQLTDDGPDAELAFKEGVFVVGEQQVVMRLNPYSYFIEFFCDVGLPQTHAREEVYRRALELNLQRQYPGVLLGVHHGSGRLVASASLHVLGMVNDQICIHMMDSLVAIVGQLLDEHRLQVE